MGKISDIKHLLIDLDGIILIGDFPNKDIQYFFEFLRSKIDKFLILSNNARISKGDLMRKLNEKNILINDNEIFPMCDYTAQYLYKHFDPNSTIFIIGEKALVESVESRGFNISNGIDDGADIVLVGKDHNLNYHKLLSATILIRRGAKFIGTNIDSFAPCEYGIGPGNGATLAFLQTSTSQAPIILGKPNLLFFNEAISYLNIENKNLIAIIGDNLETDIQGGINSGIKTIYINPDYIEKMSIIPNFYFKNLFEMIEFWNSNNK